MIHTVTLETAKLLKENGFPQITDLFWTDIDGISQVTEMRGIIHDDFAAPTSDEILEELPSFLTINTGAQFDLIIRKDLYVYTVSYQHPSTDIYVFDNKLFVNKSLSDTLAQMWLWLKKEGLLGGRE